MCNENDEKRENFPSKKVEIKYERRKPFDPMVWQPDTSERNPEPPGGDDED